MPEPSKPASAIAKLQRRVEQVGSLLCVGLDSAVERLSARFRDEENPLFAFNRWLIEQTHASVSASRSVIFADDPAAEARNLNDQINQLRAALRPSSSASG